MHISVRELHPIVLALELWADQLANKRILFHFDNISVVYCINKQTYKNPDSMRLIRRLVVQVLTFHIYFEAEHVPGITNILADKLSRFQIEDFKQLATGMDPVSTEISHLVQDP
jgi:hypothetical protein